MCGIILFFIPLSNDAVDLDNLQTRTQKGTQAKDVFFTIIQTAKKLGVNAYQYIMDRVNKKFTMTPLHMLIQQKYQTI